MSNAEYKGIYCAGKISKNDWRSEILNVEIVHEHLDNNWPDRRINGIDSLFYTGPYYASGCDHGCTHGDNTHGWAEANSCTNYPPRQMHDPGNREIVFNNCKRAIQRSDVFFLWVNEFDCYGSLVELGWASAVNKYIVIAHKPEFNFIDMWFAFRCANKVIMADSPYEAFTRFVEDNTVKTFRLCDF